VRTLRSCGGFLLMASAAPSSMVLLLIAMKLAFDLRGQAAVRVLTTMFAGEAT
jgi:hypothetical protein